MPQPPAVYPRLPDDIATRERKRRQAEIDDIEKRYAAIQGSKAAAKAISESARKEDELHRDRLSTRMSEPPDLRHLEMGDKTVKLKKSERAVNEERLLAAEGKRAEAERQTRLDALNKHVAGFGSDSMSRTLGTADFVMKEYKAEEARRKAEYDKVVSEHPDDSMAQTLAIGKHYLKKQEAQSPASQAFAKNEAMQRMKRVAEIQSRFADDGTGNAFVRETFGALRNTGAAITALTARLTGNSDAADEVHRQTNEYEAAQQQARDANDMSPWLSRMYGGAASSMAQTVATPGGAYAKMIGVGLTTGDQALTTAEDAGLEGMDRYRYAATQAAIESGVAALSQKLFGPGVESRIAGETVAAATMKELVKNVGKDAFKEGVLEEIPTSILQDLSSKFENVSPDLTFDDFITHASEAAIQAVMMSGMASAPNALAIAGKSQNPPQGTSKRGDKRKELADTIRNRMAGQFADPEFAPEPNLIDSTRQPVFPGDKAVVPPISPQPGDSVIVPEIEAFKANQSRTKYDAAVAAGMPPLKPGVKNTEGSRRAHVAELNKKAELDKMLADAAIPTPAEQAKAQAANQATVPEDVSQQYFNLLESLYQKRDQNAQTETKPQKPEAAQGQTEGVLSEPPAQPQSAVRPPDSADWKARRFQEMVDKSAKLPRDEFEKAYRDKFAQMIKYTPDQVGSHDAAEEMAAMSDAHPDWVDEIDNAPEPKASPVATGVPSPDQSPKEAGPVSSNKPEKATQDEFVYHRGRDPRTSTDIVQFANDRERIGSYGKTEFAIPKSALIYVPKWAKDYAAKYYSDDGSGVEPEDIVDNAGAWDDQQFVSDFWQAHEKELLKLIDNGVYGFSTPDGAVVFPGPNVPVVNREASPVATGVPSPDQSPESAGPVSKPDPEAKPARTSTAKNPWEMPRDEFRKYIQQNTGPKGQRDYGITEDEVGRKMEWWEEHDRLQGKMTSREILDDPWGHRKIIDAAIAEGKPVPPEVLADYPDLKPQTKAEPEKPAVKPPVPRFASLPQNSQDLFNKAFESKDTEFLKKNNVAWNKEWESRTGITLPKTQKDRHQAVLDWAKPAEVAPAVETPAKTGSPHITAFRAVMGDDYADRLGDHFDRYFQAFDSLDEATKNQEYRSNERRGRSFQSELGAKVTYAGTRVGLTEDGMRNVINAMKPANVEKTEPSATEHDRLYRELQPLYRDPKHKAGDRAHMERIRDLEQQVEFHKPAAVARAQAEIDAEAAKKPPAAKPEPSIEDLNSGKALKDRLKSKVDEWIATGTNNGKRALDTRWEAGAVKRLVDSEFGVLTKGKHGGSLAAAKIAVSKARTFAELHSALDKITPEPSKELAKAETPPEASKQAVEYPEKGPVIEDWFGPDKARVLEWTKTLTPGKLQRKDYAAVYRDGKRIAAGLVEMASGNMIDILADGKIQRFFQGDKSNKFAVGIARQRDRLKPADDSEKPVSPEQFEQTIRDETLKLTQPFLTSSNSNYANKVTFERMAQKAWGSAVHDLFEKGTKPPQSVVDWINSTNPKTLADSVFNAWKNEQSTPVKPAIKTGKPPETLDELLEQFQTSTSAIDKTKAAALGVLVRGVAKYRGMSPDEYVKQRFAGVVSGGTPAEGALFSRASSRLAARLESGKKVKVYRAMQLIDGKLYPPMAAKVDGKMVDPTEIGTWEVADERPDLVRGGKFKLDKANGTSLTARYNPYFHTSRSPLNDQFSSAHKRDNLVTVEVEVPESELTSGYKAEGAKDAVGEMSWNSGPVSSKLPPSKTRKVILSRYAKVTRIVPDSEVASVIAQMLKGEGIRVPANVVTPSLRSELEKRGVNIAEVFNQTRAGIVRASVEFNKDARALIRALNSTNIADMVHELGHIFRRDLSASDMAAVEKWAGVINGKWTEAAEELWATGFERYLAEGKAPTSSMKGVFAQFKEWLADIYGAIIGSDIDVNVSDEVKEIMERLVSGPKPEKTLSGQKILPGMTGRAEEIDRNEFVRKHQSVLLDDMRELVDDEEMIDALREPVGNILKAVWNGDLKETQDLYDTDLGNDSWTALTAMIAYHAPAKREEGLESIADEAISRAFTHRDSIKPKSAEKSAEPTESDFKAGVRAEIARQLAEEAAAAEAKVLSWINIGDKVEVISTGEKGQVQTVMKNRGALVGIEGAPGSRWIPLADLKPSSYKDAIDQLVDQVSGKPAKTPRKPRTPKADTTPKPPRTKTGEKLGKLSEDTGAAAKQAWEDLLKGMKGLPLNSALGPFNKDLAKMVVTMVRAQVADKVVKFADLVARVVEYSSPEMARSLSDYLEAAWDILRETNPKLDPAGKVADVLGPEKEVNDDTRPERDESPGDGGREAADRPLGATPVEEPSSDVVSTDEGGRDTGRDGTLGGGRNEPETSGTVSDGSEGTGSVPSSPEGDDRTAGRRGRIDFRITGEDQIGVKFNSRERFEKNVEAIKVLKLVESENRRATPEEQKVLVQYVGWGGLKEAFSTRADQGLREKAILKDLLTEEELAQARTSVRNAHYTSPEVISAMWEGLTDAGFAGGRILEPSAGIGHFYGLVPESVAEVSKLSGIEMDGLTARIAQQLYQTADITHAPYQDVNVKNLQDLVISNVPFGPYKAKDKYDKSLKKKSSIHNFFFRKAMTNLRPGGVIAFITSRYTMDGRTVEHTEIREQITAAGGRFVGAVRLPNNAFMGIAKTKVTTDVIFIQKDAGDAQPWINTKEDAGGFIFNEYFHDHPENVLGKIDPKGGTQIGEWGIAPDGHDIGKELAQKIAAMPFDRSAMAENSTENAETSEDTAEDSDVPDGRLAIKGNKLFLAVGGKLEATPLWGGERGQERKFGIIRAMGSLAAVRDNLSALEKSSLATDAEIEQARKLLNTAYDRFVKEHGFVHKNENKGLFEDDEQLPTLLAMEEWDSDAKTAKKADVFETRVQQPDDIAANPTTAEGAAVESYARLGRIDLPMISDWLGKSESQVEQELTGWAYKDPATGEWSLKNVYLSGNIAKKLKDAEAAAKTNPAFQKNVEDLKRVLPPRKTAGEIHVRPKSPFITAVQYHQFMRHLGVNGIVRHDDITGSWQIDNPHIEDPVKAGPWGVGKKTAADLLEGLLNNKPPLVWGKDDAGNRKVNEAATQLARAKSKEIEDEFGKWIFSDPERAMKVEDAFNEGIGAYIEGEWDGSHLTLPGMNINITLLPHQLNAIWRAIVSGNTLLAHEVGLGKTFIMAATAMERKRLGLSKNQMFVVPNHLLAQWTSEFKALYPSAKLLSLQTDQINSQNRRTLVERIKSGRFDAIIVTPEAYKKMPMSNDVVQAALNAITLKIENTIKEAKKAKGENKNFVAKLESVLESIREKMLKMLNDPAKDAGAKFDDLGIDSLYVDEAHEYRNLWSMTQMGDISGVGLAGNQKTFDMLLKTDYLNERTKNRGLVFATGTPIANSISELYSMQRYLQPHTLTEAGVASFDDWANTFGEAITDIEVDPTGSGFRSKTRFKEFRNTIALSKMFRQVADVKYAEDKDVNLDKLRPRLRGGKLQAIQVMPSVGLLGYVRNLVRRLEISKSRSFDKRIDNPLKVTTDGRKAALDMRLVADDDSVSSKVNIAVENIARIYREETERKGVQLLWVNLGTPASAKPKPKKVAAKGQPDQDDSPDAQMNAEEENLETGRISLYEDIKQKLIAQGIPEHEIQFIHDHDTPERKRALFQKGRDGTVRILISTIKKLATGANIQTRLTGMHFFDPPWKPADIEQAVGRAIRRGNLYKDWGGVQAYTYVTKGSFDAYIWQLLENKAKAIKQIMRGEIDSVEDTGRIELNADEVKALASSNPKVLELVKVRNEAGQLRSEYYGYRQEQGNIQSEIASKIHSVEYYQRYIESAEAELKTMPLRDDLHSDFKVTIGKKTYSKRSEIGAALIEAMPEIDWKDEAKSKSQVKELADNPVKIGSVLGKPIFAGRSEYDNSAKIIIADIKNGDYFKPSDDDTGNGVKLFNYFDKKYDEPGRLKGNRDQLKLELAALQQRAGVEWPKSARMNASEARLRSLEAELGSAAGQKGALPVVSELTKFAIMAEKLGQQEGRAVTFDGTQWMYGDRTPVPYKSVTKEMELEVDNEVQLLLVDSDEKPQALFFFRETAEAKAKKEAEGRDAFFIQNQKKKNAGYYQDFRNQWNRFTRGSTPGLGAALTPEMLRAVSNIVVGEAVIGAKRFSVLIKNLRREFDDAIVNHLKPMLIVMWNANQGKYGLDEATPELFDDAMSDTVNVDVEKTIEAAQAVQLAEEPQTEPSEGDKEFSTQNAFSAEARQELDMGERPPVEKQSRNSSIEAAEAYGKTTAGSKFIDTLIQELTTRPRAVTPWENDLLNYRHAELDNGLESSLRKQVSSQKSGDDAQEAVAEREARALRTAMWNLIEFVLEPIGTAAGRALQARKAIINRSYTMVRLALEFEATHKREANPAELAAMQKQIDDLNAVIAQLEKSLAESDAKNNEYAELLKIAHDDLVNEAAAPKPAPQPSPQPAPAPPASGPKEKSHADKRIDAALKALGKHQFFSVEGTFQMLPELVELAAGYIEKGVDSFNDYIDMLSKRFGRKPQADKLPALQQGWDIAWETEKNKPTATPPDDSSSITDKIDIDVPDTVGRAARALHGFVIERDGLDASAADRNNAVVAVHEILVDFVPDITHEETARAMSGIGIFSELSDDKIEVIRRDQKAQLLLLEQLKAWELARLAELKEKGTGVPPLQTGRQHGEKGPEQREIQKRVNEAKKASGVDTTTPGMLRSAFAAAMRQVSNRIADLTKALDTDTPITRSKTVLPDPTGELKKKQDQRDALQKLYDEAFGRPELSDAQRRARLEKGLDLSIENLKSDLGKGKIYPDAAKAAVSSAAIEAKRAVLAFWASLRDEARLQSGEQQIRSNAAKQLAAKALAEKRIAALEKALESGQRISGANQQRLTPDAELAALQTKRDAIKKLYDAAFPRPELTEEQRKIAAEKALDRAIAGMEADLKANKLYPAAPKAPVTSPAIEAKRAALDALKAVRDEMRVDSGQAEQRSNAAYERILKERDAKLAKRIADKDFAPRPKKPARVLTPSQLVMMRDISEKQLVIDKQSKAWIFKKRHIVHKVWKTGPVAVAHTLRKLKTGFDESYIGRQGWLLGLTHPIIYAKAIRKGFASNAVEARSIFPTPQDVFNAVAELDADAGMVLMEKTGKLAVTGVHGGMAKLNEEGNNFVPEWVDDIWGVGGSERAAAAFINTQRRLVFRELVNQLATMIDGKRSISAAELRVIGNIVNVATGRGSIGKYTNALEAWTLVFFSPRWWASRLNWWTLQPLWHDAKWTGGEGASTEVRILAAKEWAKQAVAQFTMMGLAVAGLTAAFGPPGEDEEWDWYWDPRSPKFGNIRVGNSYFDMTAGLAQHLSYFVRFISGTQVNRWDTEEVDRLRLLMNYGRGKLAPVPSIGVDFAAGKSMGDGLKFGSQEWFSSQVEPLISQDIRKAFKNEDIPLAFVLSTWMILGGTAQSWEARTKSRNDVANELRVMKKANKSPEKIQKTLHAHLKEAAATEAKTALRTSTPEEQAGLQKVIAEQESPELTASIEKEKGDIILNAAARVSTDNRLAGEEKKFSGSEDKGRMTTRMLVPLMVPDVEEAIALYNEAYQQRNGAVMELKGKRWVAKQSVLAGQSRIRNLYKKD